MPSLAFGMQSFTGGDWLDEVGVNGAIEIAKRRGTGGSFVKSKAFNPTNDFSIKGGGSVVAAVGLASLSITGLTGGVKYVEKSTHTEKNNDFDDMECSGPHMPGASDAG